MIPIHHLAWTVRNLRASDKFCDAVLGAIGREKVLSQDRICGWEKNGFEFLLWAAKPGLAEHEHRPYQPGCHQMALRVPTPVDVIAVSRVLTDAAAVILEGPQTYPQYPGNYVAVIFRDPDRFKLELMCQ